MGKTARLIAAAVIVLGTCMPAVAHHAFSAEFDQNKPVQIEGTISKVEWINPHAWIWLDVKGEDGKVVAWSFEMGSPGALLRNGWKRDDIKPGTPVSVNGFLARAGGPVGNAYVVKLPNGKDLFAGSSAGELAPK